ncbi:ASCH domain-containing protein [Bdellovibrio sp. BCCA]|uniref:ASCH domain-containing protein n=1 Tax=Bdellovibrio sp. BCCA TaxID=3136281 RepID=UPI0030F15684
MKGFIVRQPWADLILSGKKTWEIRSSNTNIRGTVGVVCEGKWIGTVVIDDSRILTPQDFEENRDKHCVPASREMKYKQPHAWILSNPVNFREPKDYHHKQGCVIWVNLPDIERG